MDYQEFSNKVQSLGMKRTEFVRYLGMSKNAYTKWSMENKVPHLVGLHLDLLCKVSSLLPDLSQYKAKAGTDNEPAWQQSKRADLFHALRGGKSRQDCGKVSLLLNVMVQDAIQKAMAKRGKRAEISQDRVLLKLTRVKLRQGLDFTLRLPYRLSLLVGMIRARMNSKSPTAISGEQWRKRLRTA